LQVPTKVARGINQVPTKLAYGVKALADGDDNKEAVVGDVFPKAE
jgi:large subunit ribosomal protein L10